MSELQHDWIRQRATRLESGRPQVSNQEQAAVDRIMGSATVIAFGEMTHGSQEMLHSRARLLRFLIQERNVRTVVLEACFAGTRQLNEYVISGEGTARQSLASTEYSSCVNSETLEFVEWIREHNASPAGQKQPVRVYGCDVQSLDNPKAELARLLRKFGRTGELAAADCTEAIALLDSLPTDRELYRHVESLMSEASSPRPDGAKIAEIQARRLEQMTGVRKLAGPLASRLGELQRALPPNVPTEDRFFFGRCIRLVEQAVAFYFPDGHQLRDQFMAENVAALIKHFSGERLALASHNLHVARTPLSIRGEQFVPMGCLLAQELGEDYKVIGSAFHHGKFLAEAGEREGQDEVVAAHTPRANAFEFFLHLYGAAERAPDFLLDLGSPRKEFPGSVDVEMRLGEAGSQGNYEQSFMRQSPETQFDGLIFITETTPISVLPEYYVRAREKWGTKSGEK